MGFKINPEIKKFGFTQVWKVGNTLLLILLTLVSGTSYPS
jgi:hypothetical protein